MALTRKSFLAATAALGGAVAAPAVPGVPTAAEAKPGPRRGTSRRARYHFTVPEGWKNDPQRPLYRDGEYLYYYLYNGDYIEAAEGTDWRLATTADGVSFTDRGIAAPKDASPNGDLWSGCAVADEEDTAGFGAGAIIILATQEDRADGDSQAQFLWYSTDGGRSFTHDGAAPVLANPGVEDFRDPKVLWHGPTARWVMLLAEGPSVGFYTSPDLKSWTESGRFDHGGLGTLECPDLFWIESDSGPGRWVLGVSGNAKGAGLYCTYAYWTGDFDGTSFAADRAEPRWLDHGFDWYGAVTWEKVDAGEPDPATRYARAWMNFWDYPHETPTWDSDGYNGTDSLTREIRLHWPSPDEAVLLSSPVEALEEYATSVVRLGDVAVEGRLPLDYTGHAYEISADISWETAENVGFQLRRSPWGSRHVDVGVHADYVYLNRGGTWNPDRTATWLESTSPFDPARKSVRLRIFVDHTSVEVFVDDGRHVHTSQAFPDLRDEGIALYSHGGGAVFSDLVITEYEV
ncbi:glycoside hydrolase family 32 protein [Salininema proteolyticum]|uniref:Glycoside hydrolase family 32 protein n=1 Tax=Salininema proteolyticum TaxID=1607685 RepID=A0ABV8U1J6_9ACTN